MSQSLPFQMGNIGSDGVPVIDATSFDMFMESYGFNVRLRKTPAQTDKNCPCYDIYAMSADPNCPYCGGSGSLEGFVDQIVRGFILFKLPKGNWNIGNEFTMAGHLERIQVIGFFPGSVNVQMNDYVLLNMASPITAANYFAFRVDTLMPRLVGDGRGNYIIVFNRAELRHVEFPIAGGI
jgi:hypothetical protein